MDYHLEINLYDLPELNDVKIQGVKKGKVEELIKETDLKKGKIVNENLLTTTKNYIENKYKNTKIKDIDEEFLIDLKIEIDDKFGDEEEFEIEIN